MRAAGGGRRCTGGGGEGSVGEAKMRKFGCTGNLRPERRVGVRMGENEVKAS